MAMLSDATLAYGERMVVALLGVDALIRRSGAAEDDRLVVLNMAPDHQPQTFTDLDAAIAHVEDLRRQARALPEADRRRYYDQLCVSTIALMRWRQGLLTFPDQISQFLHVPPLPASESELAALRRQISSLLTSLRYSGDLHTQCDAWHERHRVPADEVAGVLQELMDEAWDRTVQRFEIPAPRSDGMRVAMVSGAHFNARCNYLERTVELNASTNATRQSLKHLAVHECYPGHYVQFKLRETWYREGVAPTDGLLSIVNSASSVEDYPDPQDYCTLLLRPGYPRDIGEWNNAQYNSLVDRGEVTFNRGVRQQLYIQAQHIALSQRAWISVGQATDYAMVKPYVHGFVGSEAFYELIPRGNNWANITISPH
jgi:hypothetical protein